ncbi:MAG TPA: peptidylprolyl isomerase, partial [Enterococcus sp.]|nr:peptidylprolyl isomerase [Enterococcus sp.]
MSKVSNKAFAAIVGAIVIVGLAVILIFSFTNREIVATVGDSKITKDELYDKLVEQGGSNILSQMIDAEIINQEAKKEKIQVTDEEIDAEMENYMAQYGGEEMFESVLQQSGLTKDDLKGDIIQYVQIEKLVDSRISVTDEEINEYFEENKEKLGQEEQVKASHILVEDEKTAKDLKKQLDDGADFAELAKEHSTDPGSAENGGELGFFGKGKMVKEFEDVAFATKVGEISEPVKSEKGYHIIKVEEKKEAKEATLEEKKEEIKDTLYRNKV